MIRVAIVDDDQKVHNELRQYIEDYEPACSERFAVMSFYDGREIVDNYRPVYDIIFMDIQMQEMDGMTAAEAIRQVDEDVIIVFVTNMADFAIKGYMVDALSYVVKPIRYIDFEQQLSKAVKRVMFNRNAFMLVTVNGEILRVDIAKVAYMESVEHRVTIHLDDDQLTVYSSLKKLEVQVSGHHFARCNSGYLVSLRHVERIEGDEVIVGGNRLLISRSKKKPFMNALAEFIGGDFN